ncbi:unnamed protein product [Protopolystoma xenopodis]|uniref:Uncharacterized protein n=1 Tax=Protopolystoma xenopodis TaxID=117903 RepID=A0A3S5FEZ0_9PLAT|nr:unnamed protein product [Protopolystoma xenopodis]
MQCRLPNRENKPIYSAVFRSTTQQQPFVLNPDSIFPVLPGMRKCRQAKVSFSQDLLPLFHLEQKQVMTRLDGQSCRWTSANLAGPYRNLVGAVLETDSFGFDGDLAGFRSTKYPHTNCPSQSVRTTYLISTCSRCPLFSLAFSSNDIIILTLSYQNGH